MYAPSHQHEAHIFLHFSAQPIEKDVIFSSLLQQMSASCFGECGQVPSPTPRHQQPVAPTYVHDDSLLACMHEFKVDRSNTVSLNTTLESNNSCQQACAMVLVFMVALTPRWTLAQAASGPNPPPPAETSPPSVSGPPPSPTNPPQPTSPKMTTWAPTAAGGTWAPTVAGAPPPATSQWPSTTATPIAASGGFVAALNNTNTTTNTTLRNSTPSTPPPPLEDMETDVRELLDQINTGGTRPPPADLDAWGETARTYMARR